ILNVVGARPNFIKIAPIMAAYAGTSIQPMLVHTGQHYDRQMSELFFEELGIPPPDMNLGIGPGTVAQQTAAIMSAFEPVVIEHNPDVVLVVGDVTSTVACALVAAKLGVKLAHVEAGLRSFDRTMPEELNRLVTDALSDLLFCTEHSGVENLRREGVSDSRVHFVGNVMIDTLLRNREKAQRSPILEQLDLKPRQYALLTVHRPSNVDHEHALGGIFEAIDVIGREMPVVLPIHPRTRKALESSSLSMRIKSIPSLRLIDPAGYIDFVKLISSARVVLTDSGGIQEETTILGVPCLTLRDNTERPVTIECGWNQLVGSKPDAIVQACRAVTNGHAPGRRTPPLWDGMAAQRIVEILIRSI
ncbi:MAG TPA: UDP-N-acetylglucosamine 2-epimerase (non-hydrolyzing), partial [Gemmataceae bacterium]